MKRLSLLLLLLGIVVVFSVGLSTARYDIERLSDQMKQTQQVLAEVDRRSYGRDVELARRIGWLKAHVEDVEGRVADLEDPNMAGVLLALVNTVVVTDGYGHGSGVILTDGYVLTAGHCSGVTMVKTLDGAVYGVKSEYVHPEYDVAILYVPGIKGGIELGPEPELFDRMYVIGAPFDPLVAGTVSEGMFTNDDRDVGHWIDAYQVTCDAGPGNSGGPVVDERGRLVGIVVGGPDPGSAVTIVESIHHIIETMAKCVF